MNKTAASRPLLHLLVRMYNQFIQSYYYFPDIIICGRHRLEREEFEFLLAEGFIVCHHTDSFGKVYHLSKKAEQHLQQETGKRKHRRLAYRHYTGRQCLLF